MLSQVNVFGRSVIYSDVLILQYRYDLNQFLRKPPDITVELQVLLARISWDDTDK